MRATARRNSADLGSADLFWWGVSLSCLMALVLRAWAAQGPLWLDELWTVDLVRSFGWRSVMLVFDNNHPLNTAWSNLVGADAPPWLLRLPGVLAGPATALAAGLLLKESSGAAVLASAMVALCSLLIVVGSESRGYGMMLAAVFVMLWAIRRGSAEPTSHWRQVMALATLTAVLAQPLAAGAAAASGVSFLWLRSLQGHNLSSVCRDGLRFFGPAVLACAALASMVLIQAILSGARLGDHHPFEAANLVDGWLSLQGLVLGLPADQWPLTLLACLTIITMAALTLEQRALAMTLPLWLVSPILMAILQLPNTQYPRYHLVSGCGLLLILSALGAAYWLRGGFARVVAVTLLLSWLAGQAMLLVDFGRLGRGDFLSAIKAATLEAQGQDQPVSIGADSEARGLFLVTDATRRSELVIAFVPRYAFCSRPPTLFIRTGRHQTTKTLPLGEAQGCRKLYTLTAEVEASRLNGMPGAIYKLEDGEPSKRPNQ